MQSDPTSARREEGGRRLTDQLARLLVDGLAEYAIFALDPDGRVATWNAGAVRITGYGEEEAVGRPRSAYLPPEEQEVPALEIAAEKGHCECRGWRVRRDGERFWASELITALRDDSGRLVAFAVLLRDETPQRRAEMARQRSEEMFAGIVNLSADAIVSVDAGQRIVLFNPAAERIFGHAADEVLGRPLDVLIPERYREAHRRHVQAFAASREGARLMGARDGTGHLWGLRADGETFPIAASISRSRVGGEVMLTAVVRDVTEQVREAEARDFLARAGMALDASLDYETTLHDVARLAVPGLADWCTVYLVGEDGTVRRLEAAHVDPALDPVLRALREYVILPGTPHPALQVIETGEPRLISPFPPELMEEIAQDPRHLEILRQVGLRSAVVAPLAARGRTFGALGLYRAATRLHDGFDLWLATEVGRRAGLAIDNARLYREARQAVRARDEVVSVVSHDLRNPLNTIVLSAQMALSVLEEGGDGEAAAGRIRAVLRSAARMDRLVQDLLDITRIESGRLVLDCRPVQVAPLLDDARDSLAPLAAEAGQRLAVEVEEGVPPVYGDRDRLHQVLSNLVGNALKFTPRGGEVVLRARPGEGRVVLSVADTGAGIPARDLPHVFDRFWQARRTDRRGLGLGLPIVKGIVEAHGGEVWAESREGAGTTVSFALPLGGAAGAPAGGPGGAAG
jgi:PAS domain S-box-containing protein